MLNNRFILEILRAISFYIEYLVFIKILNLLFEGKRQNKHMYISFIILLTPLALIFITKSSQFYNFMNVSSMIFCILFAICIYKSNYFKIIIYYFIYNMTHSLVFNILLFTIQMCVTQTLMSVRAPSAIEMNIIDSYYWILCIIANISFIYILKKMLTFSIEKRNIIYIIGCILVNLSITFMNYLPRVLNNNLQYLYDELNRFNLVMVPKLSSISSILLLIIAIKIIKDTKEKREGEIIREKLDMQYNYYLSIQKSQMKVKRLYHDINNHMICIKNMSNDKEDVNKYIDSINEELNEFKEIYNTGNMILDIILNEKKTLCDKNNIDLFCDINFSKCNFMEMADVCSIFSNILDNAIEACNKINSQGKYIKIRGSVVKSYYVIKCENSKRNKVNIKNNKIITSKKDKFIHGIGLKSVKSSLKKYNGELEIEDFESKFILKIYIPINKNMTVGEGKIPVMS